MEFVCETKYRMSSEVAQLSNPFSTGGGGPSFENHVQAAFVVLMLTGGVVPCLQPWPIKKIKLQGRYEGYNTDDFVAFVEGRDECQKAKLLAQIKHSVSVTANDTVFGDVIQAAWKDFLDPDFDQRTDAIALITGPLSAHDTGHARTVLEWARHSESAREFLNKVNRGNFSSDTKRNKLKAFRSQLKKANQGADVDDERLWKFLKTFHLLGYDLDITSGVTLSLLKSHIEQFSCGDIPGLWATIANEVASFNQNAGTITPETISETIRTAFSKRISVEQIPDKLLKKKSSSEKQSVFPSGEKGNAMMYAALLGSWDDESRGDLDAIRKLIEVK